MIANSIKFIFFFFGIGVFAQPNTEVYVMDMTYAEEKVTISNFRNMSDNEGYDNQPSFFDNNTLIYAYTRDGNTDIMISSVHSAEKISYFTPTEGGEYSPQIIPGSRRISAVRLDKDGTQRLYDHTPGKDVVTRVFEDLQVAYYAYYNADTVLASVLAGDRLDLVLANVKTQKVDTLLENSGRSIHKVPFSKSMSYTLANEEGNMDIYQLDMETLESFFVTQLPVGIQDHVWLSDSMLICGSLDKLYRYDLFGKGSWEKMADLSEYNIMDITRLAVSPDGSKLSLVAIPKP